MRERHKINELRELLRLMGFTNPKLLYCGESVWVGCDDSDVLIRRHADHIIAEARRRLLDKMVDVRWDVHQHWWYWDAATYAGESRFETEVLCCIAALKELSNDLR